MTQTSTAKPTTIDMDRALQGIHYEKNVPIPTRDGSYVSANIFRPDTEQQVPALLCYSIYAKDLHEQDGFPEIWADMLERLPNIFDHSTCTLHTHETNDPELWCPWGYACVRVDVPGSGKSPGFLDPFSPNEARAGFDAVEWIAAQPWCNGKVGMTGISYLAIAQWRVATEQPPHLAAIVPWEGVSDYYRDWNRHGGMLSSFFAGWYGMQAVRLQHGNASPWFDLDDGAPIGGPDDLSEEELRADRMDPVAEFRPRELDSPWWRERSADFDRITVPLLSGANWGGNALHLRGNVEAYVRSASQQKWLEIHGGNHRDDYYLPAGEELQREFFDHFLKGEDNGWGDRPPVMLKIRSVEDTFEPRAEREWPLARTQWTKLYLDGRAGTLGRTHSETKAATSFEALGDGLAFRLTFDEETELTGPLAAKLHVSSSTTDADLFVTLEDLRPDGSEITFFGSSDQAVPLAQGWLRASHRKLDPSLSTDYRPYHAHDEKQPLTPGEPVEMQVEIWPTCLVFPAGYTLELLVAGTDFVRREVERAAVYEGLGQRMSREAGDGADRSDLFRGSGAFLHNDPVDRPAEVFGGTTTIHTGGGYDSYLLVPVIPKA